MKLKITKDFAFAHRGCEIVRYTAGTEVETDDKELIDTALGEKWASKAREARQNKDNGNAPENKVAGGDNTEQDDDGDGQDLVSTEASVTGDQAPQA